MLFPVIYLTGKETMKRQGLIYLIKIASILLALINVALMFVMFLRDRPELFLISYFGLGFFAIG
jgi:hypothetical protein